MPSPTEHKTVQARILEYAEAIGWTFVSQKEAEQRRGFDPPSPKGYGGTSPETPIKDRAKGRTLFFEDLLDANPSPPIGYAAARVREFNPRYAEAEGALPGKFRHLHTDIYGNREFSAQRCLNRKERKERIEDLGSESLRSLCSLRYFISEFRGFDRRERRERIEDSNSGSLSSLCSLRLAISEFFDHEEKREREVNRE